MNHGSVGFSDDEWSRVEQWIVVSDPDTPNGVYEYWVNRTLQQTTGAYATDSSCSAGGRVDSWISPNNVNRSVAGEYWVDVLYVDDTRQRVELGDAPSWSDCTERVIQIPRDSWTDTSVTIEVNAGPFRAGDYWLFVVDADGSPSAGYPVRFE